jgi:hypothetical protein
LVVLSELHAAACRLATGMTELLISEVATYTPLLSSDLAAQLVDGSLRQYIHQLVSPTEETVPRRE